MELCDKGDLFSKIEKTKYKLPEAEVGYIIHSVLTALYYLQEFGVVHRDIKPENLLLSSCDNEFGYSIKIIDFGLSKIIGTNQFCTEPYGTLVNFK